MGAWSYIEPRILNLLSAQNKNREIRYVGRPSSAAPAVGKKSMHEKEMEVYLDDAVVSCQ